MHAVYAWHFASALHCPLTAPTHDDGSFATWASQVLHALSNALGGFVHTDVTHAERQTSAWHKHVASTPSRRSLPPGFFASQHWLQPARVVEPAHGPLAGFVPPLPPVALLPLAPEVPPLPAPPLPLVTVLPPHATPAIATSVHDTPCASRPGRMRRP